MDNIKDDEYKINKLLKDINFVIDVLKNITLEEFEKNEILCDSICFRFIQISETASKISIDFIEKYSAIPIYQLKGMRNRIVHDYGNVDMSIVYYTVKNDLSILKDKLINSLKIEVL